ncbi:hypothetical protein [Desulfuribacillus alkaliarsenatis]|uniref:Uncharacterized protein n=1 Tax=Desulfuribacillus alkaliarsenatis TaxID=766136 RepID=A0A1E5G428_9FIRM|nr:hypothetical protein [Desulfuribacillus alkaliarsenatis]OEF97781.1 hypothetical protein BHF68_13915 [Desulfuribacillus alkaliarsenatis]
MSYTIEGLRNFKINNLLDYSGDFKIFVDEEKDYIDTTWTAKSFMTLNYFMCKNTEFNWAKILPAIDLNLDRMSSSEIHEFNEKLIDPKLCIEIFNERCIIEKALEYDVNIHEKLSWLYINWKKGFYIYYY